LQTFAAHVSVFVQASPSSHDAVFAVKTQPVAGAHESSVQTLPSLHVCAAPATQTLAAHLSLTVQALPSSHEEVFAVWTQPVAGAHVSSVQTLLSSQLIAVPAQVPAVHTSVCVHALKSSHVVPSVTGFGTQLPAASLHTPVLHALAAPEQSRAAD
jgi:hypothetical protein